MFPVFTARHTVSLLLVATLFLPHSAQAWEIYQEREKDGRVFSIAEQAGDAGAFLNLVCLSGKTHIEIIYPAPVPAEDDFVELLQVDAQPERLVAGYIEAINDNTSVFIGVDRRDQPAASTPDLLRQISAGSHLYLGDPDRTEATEHWSLIGARKAIRKLRKMCT